LYGLVFVLPHRLPKVVYEDWLKLYIYCGVTTGREPDDTTGFGEPDGSGVVETTGLGEPDGSGVVDGRTVFIGLFACCCGLINFGCRVAGNGGMIGLNSPLEPYLLRFEYDGCELVAVPRSS